MRAGAARINLREACSAPGAVRAQALAAAGCSGFVRICRRAAKPPRASRTRLRACVGGERHARAQCKTGHRRWRGEPCAAHPSSVARVAAACVRGQAPRTDVPPQTLTVLWPQRRRACRVRGVRSSVRRPPCCARIRSDSQDSALAPGICWRMRVPSACPPHQAGPPRAVREAALRGARAHRAGRRAAARCTRCACRHDGPRTTRREHGEHASPAAWPPAAGADCRACPRAFALGALRRRSRGKSAVFLQRAKPWSGAAFLWFTKMCTLVNLPSTNSTATGLYRY